MFFSLHILLPSEKFNHIIMSNNGPSRSTLWRRRRAAVLALPPVAGNVFVPIQEAGGEEEMQMEEAEDNPLINQAEDRQQEGLFLNK